MKVYVDARPSEIACVPEQGTPYLEILVKIYTNNEAEYLAVLRCMDKFSNITEILSDSQLVINQLNHVWNIKEERIRRLAIQVWESAAGKVKFVWIPRKQNLAGKLLG